ncbi:hypothetical protein CCFV1_ORF030 [Cotesia congregata filamentous virus 1]|uniref:Uncharacterized protein n=1 Tax=Cotesia congregata filamentous virus 1 TaxID=3064291 RepID=A0ABC8QR10_9VIRU|nr:hypothetical protein CCFV1_ORF030 [Cotesia congregata filamentous virus 1]
MSLKRCERLSDIYTSIDTGLLEVEHQYDAPVSKIVNEQFCKYINAELNQLTKKSAFLVKIKILQVLQEIDNVVN